MVQWTLKRNAFGKLVLTDEHGQVHEHVVPVRAFPIGAPHDGFSLVDPMGKELVWIDRLEQVPETIAELVREELARREFMPTIQRIVGVSSYAAPCTWEVETDRGLSRFVLKGEEDIRRIAAGALMISDRHGVQYLIRDVMGLDKGSKRVLDRFM